MYSYTTATHYTHSHSSHDETLILTVENGKWGHLQLAYNISAKSQSHSNRPLPLDTVSSYSIVRNTLNLSANYTTHQYMGKLHTGNPTAHLLYNTVPLLASPQSDRSVCVPQHCSWSWYKHKEECVSEQTYMVSVLSVW